MSRVSTLTLVNTADNFRAGNVARFADAWFTLSGDPWLRGVVSGVVIPFWGVPRQNRVPHPYRLGPNEMQVLQRELEKLGDKGVIEPAIPQEGQFISNVFLRPKPNGEFRLILDLTELNKWVAYEHFKMASLQTAIEMLRPECWMGSVDLKDAYYSVLVRQDQRKYLRFIWGGQLFQFVGLPNGLACAPRIFTKLLTPVYATLREGGVETFPYIDDSFVIADDREICRQGLMELATLLDSLGLVVHEGKSVLEPTQSLVFLGFRIDSIHMEISLPQEKRERFCRAAGDLLYRRKPSIREVAGLVGLMVAYAPAVEYGGAHIKWLEIDKNEALARTKGNFDASMYYSDRAETDIRWWLESLGSARKVRLDPPEVEICTDASLEGWGAHRGETTAGGRWLEEEKAHINVLELKAILLGLKSLNNEGDSHIRVLTDNTTALAYVKNMGGVKSVACNEVAGEIWDWCEQRGLWLTIAHIPGVFNTVADYMSRNFADNLEWELSTAIFTRICRIFGEPEVDLFASRINNKVEKYVSWAPDPKAWRIDAFSFEWTDAFYYAFPPFSLVGRVIQKAVAEGTRLILVVPKWPGQTWYARLQLVSRRRLHFRGRKRNLKNLGQPENRGVLERCHLEAYLLWDKNC